MRLEHYILEKVLPRFTQTENMASILPIYFVRLWNVSDDVIMYTIELWDSESGRDMLGWYTTGMVCWLIERVANWLTNTQQLVHMPYPPEQTAHSLPVHWKLSLSLHLGYFENFPLNCKEQAVVICITTFSAVMEGNASYALSPGWVCFLYRSTWDAYTGFHVSM